MSNLSNFGSQVCTKYIFAVVFHAEKEKANAHLAHLQAPTQRLTPSLQKSQIFADAQKNNRQIK